MKLKPWQNIFHVIVNANSIVQHVIQIKNGIIKHVNVNVKIIVSAKKDYSWNSSICICEKSKYLKSIADTSLIAYEKKSNTIATNVSINFHNEKVRYKLDCYISHTILLVIILLLIITIICYDYAKHRSKQKDIDAITI